MLNMSIEKKMKDKVTVLKPDGTKEENIKALVLKDKIYILGKSVLLNANDFIIRHMSNGGEETYKVIVPGFMESQGSIPALYIAEVIQLGIHDAKKEIQSITYHVSGNNVRINQNSIDNSINTVCENPTILSLLQDLRTQIDKLSLAYEEKQNALDIVDSIETTCKTEKPSKHVVSTLLNALPQIESLTTIIATIRSFFP